MVAMVAVGYGEDVEVRGGVVRRLEHQQNIDALAGASNA